MKRQLSTLDLWIMRLWLALPQKHYFPLILGMVTVAIGVVGIAYTGTRDPLYPLALAVIAVALASTNWSKP